MVEDKGKTTVAEFNCPACGSPDRLGKHLSDKVKARGMFREEQNYYVWKFEGVVQDPAREMMVPIGSALPFFRIYMDMCLKCGCLYAAKVETGHVVKKLLTMKGKPPGGAPFSPS